MKKVLTVTMDGIRYHASRPADCRHCFFWKNRKKGCVLGKENCYYSKTGRLEHDNVQRLCKYGNSVCSGLTGSETAEICGRAVLERLDIIIHEA